MPEFIRDPYIQTGLFAIVGVVLTRLAFRQNQIYLLAGQLVFFLCLTVLLFHNGITPYMLGPSAEALPRAFIALSKIIWWINAGWLLVSFVRVFLIFERRPREGRLLQDLLVGLIYVGTLLSVVSYVFNAPIGTLIATSGVFAVILGLALQSTLNDVFSGIALNLGRPYAVGDWLVLSNGIEGRVVETNWRATHLVNGNNDLVIVPNSDLAKARLTNLDNPDRGRTVKLTMRFCPTVEPMTMREVMRTALLGSKTLLATPEPTVQVVSLDAVAVSLELGFRVANRTLVGGARSEVLDMVYRHAKAAGLTLAPPAESVAMTAAPGPQELPHTIARRMLDAVTLFASLAPAERDALAEGMTRHAFRPGEILARQGEVQDALTILRSGVATVKQMVGYEEEELDRLGPGNFFGENGLLTNTGERGTVQALTFVVVYRIEREALARLAHERPEIADELGAYLAQHDDHASHLQPNLRPLSAQEAAPSLAVRIRHLFGL